MWPFRRREAWVWSPWMSPAEIDQANGLVRGPAEVPPARPVHPSRMAYLRARRSGLSKQEAQEYAERYAMVYADGEPVLLLDDGEGLLC